MKRILLFSRDPGAANTVVPIYKRLQNDSSYQCVLAGKEFALKSYENEGLVGIDISCEVIDENTAANFLSLGQYDLIVTGVHSNDFTDRYLWSAAKKLNIPTIAILDQWMNYRARFTMAEPGVDASSFPLIMPDYVCVMDEMAKVRMLDEGLEGTEIKVTGQPHFETIKERMINVTDETISDTRNSLSLREGVFVLTFVSEPIVEAYDDPMFLGYTEFTVLDELIDILIDECERTGRKADLVIRLHPRNNPALFESYLKKGSGKLKIIVDQSVVSQHLIAVSDLIVGLSSMFLLESVIAQKPIISAQLGLKREDPFMLSRLGYIDTITERDSLQKEIAAVLDGEPASITKIFSVVENPTENIIEIIKSMV
ncbi:hypothetical protein KC851_02970 [Candidatus Kaiserbacteria bacterium]|nr:hypothetical protein [Candidatus Kaiserbacteria bacterium]